MARSHGGAGSRVRSRAGLRRGGGGGGGGVASWRAAASRAAAAALGPLPTRHCRSGQDDAHGLVRRGDGGGRAARQPCGAALGAVQRAARALQRFHDRVPREAAPPHRRKARAGAGRGRGARGARRGAWRQVERHGRAGVRLLTSEAGLRLRSYHPSILTRCGCSRRRPRPRRPLPSARPSPPSPPRSSTTYPRCTERRQGLRLRRGTRQQGACQGACKQGACKKQGPCQTP